MNLITDKIYKSPLRYPGSKQKLAPKIANLLINNSIKPDVFIEAFSGGASISIYLLQLNLVNNIALIEKDPLLASFWKTVFYDSEWLIKQINKIDVTIENWQKFKKYKPRTIRNKALKCLFLNRTNFSGILKAGPIGGKNQESKYKIDCRFNKKRLIETIEKLSLFRNKVLFIEEGDYSDILNKKLLTLSSNSFIYFDPPYVKKADQLYNYFFKMNDHIKLKDYIYSLSNKWLLTYDYDLFIIDLYSDKKYNQCVFDMTYTVSSNKNRKSFKEFISSNLELNYNEYFIKNT